MFLITYDNTEELPYIFGNATLDGSVLPGQVLRYKFRLYDDDGELMFSGLSNDRVSLVAFEPLDYAQDRYGCTEIHYLQDNGEWEQL